MSAAPPWARVRTEATKRIEELRDQLERSGPEHVSRLQGEISGLRFVLRLEDNLSHPDKLIGDPPPN